MNGRLGGRPRRDGSRPAGQVYAAAIGSANRLADLLETLVEVNKNLMAGADRGRLQSAIATLGRLQERWNKQLQDEIGE